MNYLQVLADAYQGKGMSAFSADLQQELSKDREELARDGFTLVIEPLPEMQEKVIPAKDGGKMVRYFGQLVYAFKTPEGKLYQAPSHMESEVVREKAIEHGAFVFLVDANGTVVGWADDLTGNSHGARMPSIKTGDWNSLIVMIPWIIAAAILVIGGFLYSSLTMSR